MENNDKKDQNLIDILLDEDNNDPIVLVNADGKKVGFEQVAVIPIEEKTYFVLHPIGEPNIADGEVAIFYSDDEDSDNPVLRTETDENKIRLVLDELEKMLDEALASN